MTDRQPDEHTFGGEWTTRKLEVLGKYLRAYSTALQDKPTPSRRFKLAYIDGFAGSGRRRSSAERGLEPDSQGALFAEADSSNAPQPLLDGSARLALRVEPPFDTYIFIERSLERCRQLEALCDEFPGRANSILILRGDANEEIQKLCRRRWADYRAVLFLDPYGMQVEWRTLEAIAQTRAIDLWLLFPLWMGVNRVLTQDGEISTEWRQRLDAVLGTSDWYEGFYTVIRSPTLFGEETAVVKATTDVIGKWFIDRLRRIFPGVSEPGVLRNSRGSPLYLLCFAASNERGARIALRIADDLLKGLR